MEGLVDLLPLLFVAAYYLLRARRRMEQRQQENPTPRPQEHMASETKGPTPFQQFLEQIDEAVAEATGGAPIEDVPEPPRALPTPLPAPPAKPVRPAAPLRPATEFRAVEGSFDAPTPVDHVRHGFGPDNPLSEEQFERRAPQSPRPPRRGPLPDPHRLKPTSQATPAPIPGLSHWRTKLRDPKAARDAFVLQTIFGSRGGRKGDPR